MKRLKKQRARNQKILIFFILYCLPILSFIFLPTVCVATYGQWAQVTVSSDESIEPGVYDIFVDNDIIYLFPLFIANSPTINKIIVKKNDQIVLSNFENALRLSVAAQNYAFLKDSFGVVDQTYLYEKYVTKFIPDAWIIPVTRNNYSFFAPGHTSEAWRQLFMYPVYDNYEDRKNYYKEAIFEALLQSEVMINLSNDPNVLCSAILEQADKIEDLITKGIVSTELQYELTSLINILRATDQVIKPDKLKNAFEAWGKYVGNHKVYENINKYVQILKLMDIGINIESKVAQYFFLQSCIVEPLIEERINALESLIEYLDTHGGIDQAIKDALSEVKADTTRIISDRNLQYTFLSPEALGDYITFIYELKQRVPDLVTFPYLAAIEFVFGMLQDQDSILRSATLLSLQRLIGQYLVQLHRFFADPSLVDYNMLNTYLFLANINTALNYSYLSVTYKIIDGNSTYDWFKQLVWSSYGEDFEIAKQIIQGSMNNIISSTEDYALLHSPYFFGDWKQCSQEICFGAVEEIKKCVANAMENIIVKSIDLNPVQSSYQPNEQVFLSVKLEDIFAAFINDASVGYDIKNNSNIVVKSGPLAPLDSGLYQGSLIVPDIAGNYTIEVSAIKPGYRDGFGAASFIVNQPDPSLDASVEDVDWVNPPLNDFQVDIGETIRGNILVRNYGTVTTDIPIVLEIVGTGRSSTTTVYSVEPGKTKISSLLGVNTAGLTSGFYTIQVRADLPGDSNANNNLVTRNILIGQQTIIPNRLPLQSYKLYFRKYEGPLQTTPAVTISAGALSYTITATYVDNSSSWFNISGVGTFLLYKDKLYSIDTDNDGQVDNDKLFIAISGNSYSPGTNTYYFEFQVGIYDENTNAQQINPDRVVNKIATCTGSLSGMAESAKAKYDYYLEPGKSNYYAFLHVFNPELNQNILDGYICRWSFNNRDSLGSPVGNYGGSLYMYYNFTSSGRIEDYYVIVPNSTIPSGDYDFLIIQEQVIDTTGSDFFRYLGYAHSVRMRVVDYHEAEVTSIVLPPTMQSGGNYTIQVQIKNNGDSPENGIPVFLNITNNYGYNLTLNKNSGNIPAGTTQTVDFTWETLGLPSGTYTFSAFISVNGDQNTDNNSKSAQQQLLSPYLLSISGDLDKPEYGEGEVITLNVSVKDDLQNPVSSASISYKVKKAGVEVNAGVAQDQANGNYFEQFGAPYIPGNYSIEINASKIGYLSGLNNSLTFLVRDTIKPTIPLLNSPANDVSLSTQQVNFDWSDSVDSGSGVAHYQMQVSKNIDFSTNDIDMQPIASNYIATLIPGTFYWRSRSIDNANNQSDWSAVWEFTIDISTPPDTTPPTPNPMTWATPPNAAGSTSILMVATTAMDTGSPPLSYYFDFVDSPTGGLGGADSGWQSSTSYTNASLQPNHQYGYQVKARDSASTPNETSYSSTVYTYTLANAPGAASFSDITETSIRANWTDGGNPSGTQYYCENTTMGTNSGWTATTSWNSAGLSCGTSYTLRVKAKNGAGVDTGWTDLGTQATQPCSIPPVINPISDASIVEGAPYAGPTPSLSQGTLPVTWSLANGPSGMGIDSSTGVVSWSNPIVSGSPHTITIQATNTAGSDTKSWQLTVTPGPGVLSITPSEGLSSSGFEGGPFDPLSKDYILENTGGASIDWTATKTQDWVTLSALGGSLAPAAATTVTVSINSTANSLAAGTYNDTVTFTNTTNGRGNTTGGVALTISSPMQGQALYVTTNQNPLIMDVLANNGLGVSISTTIPSDMSAYVLVIVEAYDACYLETANYLKTYLANGGEVILTSGTPAYLASASPGGSTGNLSTIADWFGAGMYGNVGVSIAHISYDRPFGTTLLQGAAVGLCEGDGGATIFKNSLSMESDIIAAWDFNSNTIFSFTHTYGKGRVYYTAAQPYDEASMGLFDGAVKWVISGAAWHILHRDGAIWSSDTGWNVSTPPYYPGSDYARALEVRTDRYIILHKDGAIYDSVGNWNVSTPPYYLGTNYAVDLKVIGSGEEIILHRDGAFWSSDNGWELGTPHYYPGSDYARALEVRDDASYTILHKDGAVYDSATGWVLTTPPYYPGTNYAVDMKLDAGGYVILHKDGALWSTDTGWELDTPPYYPGSDYARALKLVGSGYKILHKDGAIYDSVDGWNVDTPPYYPGTGYAVDLEIR